MGAAGALPCTLRHLLVRIRQNGQQPGDSREMRDETTGPRHASQNQGIEMPVPFERSYWVSPSRLLAGCYPGNPDPERAADKLAALLGAGIRVCVDLTEKGEPNLGGLPLAPYEQTWRILGRASSIEVDYWRKSIRDMDVPSRRRMRSILDIIDRAIGNGRPVYVHCLGGLGRTGVVVGCWLARHGIATGPAVLDTIRMLRRNEGVAHLPSPQTARQCEMATSWHPGQ